MSRGDRTAALGNLSTSMRDNYLKHGVSEYYKKVGSVYRNPHFPGIRRCLFLWLNRWWQVEYHRISTQEKLLIFDMACVFPKYDPATRDLYGEVTLAFKEWWVSRTKLSQTVKVGKPTPPHDEQIVPRTLVPELPQLCIIAADPYTSAAYYDRTALPCSDLSFKDISEGGLPPLPSSISVKVGDESDLLVSSSDGVPPLQVTIEIVICSFALHLVENPSQLFSLLWELSLKTRWLVILAPHKKPEIKDGWGWAKWNIETWVGCQMMDRDSELLNDRFIARSSLEALLNWTPQGALPCI